MTLGMSAFTADGWLNALCNNTPFSIAQVYMQLHTGDPGAAGTANKATEVTRKSVSFGVSGAGAAGFRQIANDVAVTWVAIAGGQDASHFTLWDTVTDGTGVYLGSGLITANAYLAGDTYFVAIGAATLTLAIAT